MKEEALPDLPCGWTMTPVGDLLSFKNGLNKGKAFFGYGTPIVNYMDVFEHAGLRQQDVEGLVDVTTAEKKAFSARKGDVLFTRTSETPEEVGVSAVLLDDIENAVFSGFVLRGRPRSDRLTTNFAQYCFASDIVRSQIVSSATYTTRALTNGRILSNVKLPLPDDPREQQAIAEALSDADALIEGLERLIVKKRLIKQGAMQELLTGKRRLPGFSGEWVERKLGERGQFFKGSGVRKDEASSGLLPCVRYGELYTLHDDVVRTFASFISADVAKTARAIKSGDILFAGSGETKEEIGKCAVVTFDGDMYAGGDIIIFRPSVDDPVFLSYLLNTPAVQKRKARKGQGDAVVHISANALCDLHLLLPKKDEQSRISAVLEDMDAELQALDSRLEKARLVKEGMMQNLLTGRIRLV